MFVLAFWVACTYSLPVPIPGYPDYFVNRLGWVFSTRLHSRGDRRRLFPKRLKPGRNGDGYLHVVLLRDGKRRTVRVHRLVALTFLGPCPPGMEVCHNNGIRTDNRLENLRYATHKNNAADRKMHGTNLDGEKNPECKLTDRAVIEILRLLETTDKTQAEIAREFGVKSNHVCRIAKGKSRPYIFKLYEDCVNEYGNANCLLNDETVNPSN